MPEKSNPVKVKPIKNLGANIVFFGRIFDEAKEYAEKLAGEAGASPLAAALKIKERLKGKNVALVFTGGNISMERLKQIITR